MERRILLEEDQEWSLEESVGEMAWGTLCAMLKIFKLWNDIIRLCSRRGTLTESTGWTAGRRRWQQRNKLVAELRIYVCQKAP